MSKLQQLETSFDAKEDRIVLTLRLQDLTEYRIWLTRRYVGMLWKVLNELVEEVDEDTDKVKEKVDKQFEEEQARQQRAFSAKYGTSVSKTPLGQDPVLVTGISVQENEEDLPVICLQSDEGHKFQITADQRILISFCKLLKEASIKAKWSLDLG